jgi:hypothetical protein
MRQGFTRRVRRIAWNRRIGSALLRLFQSAFLIPSKNGNWMLCKEYNTKRKEITLQKFKM